MFSQIFANIASSSTAPQSTMPAAHSDSQECSLPVLMTSSPSAPQSTTPIPTSYTEYSLPPNPDHILQNLVNLFVKPNRTLDDLQAITNLVTEAKQNSDAAFNNSRPAVLFALLAAVLEEKEIAFHVGNTRALREASNSHASMGLVNNNMTLFVELDKLTNLLSSEVKEASKNLASPTAQQTNNSPAWLLVAKLPNRMFNTAYSLVFGSDRSTCFLDHVEQVISSSAIYKQAAGPIRNFLEVVFSQSTAVALLPVAAWSVPVAYLFSWPTFGVFNAGILCAAGCYLGHLLQQPFRERQRLAECYAFREALESYLRK